MGDSEEKPCSFIKELGITMEKSPGIPVEFDTNAPMYTFSTDAFEESIMPLLPMLSNFFAEKNIKVMILSVMQNLRLFLPRGFRYSTDEKGLCPVRFKSHIKLSSHVRKPCKPEFLQSVVDFVSAGNINESTSDHSHRHHGVDHSHEHGHDNSHEHGHTHEFMSNPGMWSERDKLMNRSDWKQRAFTVGIGGPVGSGKTALVLALCRHLRDSHGVCVVTNDIFTREDWEFLVRNEALPEERMRAVETGGCPHAAIREDFSLNMEEVKDLTKTFQPDLVIIESGGDNLAANYSRELADYIIYVIDVAGGDKVPRKGGPGITQSDLLVVNKTDLAEAVGADLKVMERESAMMRQGGPTIFSQAKHLVGVKEIADHILAAYKEAVKH